MTVRSLHDSMTAYALKYLSVVVPDDVEAVVNVAVVSVPEVCPEGHVHGVSSVAQVDLWCSFDVGPHGREVSVNAQIPLWMVKDGDTDPLEQGLEGLWEQAQFMALTYPALDGMHAAYAEMVGVPDVEEEDEEDEE